MSADLGIATFAIAQGMTSFMAFLPRLTDVRKASFADPSFTADLRIGELGAGVITMGIGGIIAALTGNKLPLIVSLFVVVTIVVLYESVLRIQPVEFEYANNPTR